MNAPDRTDRTPLGLLPDLSAGEYHADPSPEPSLSNSLIKHLLRSPRHAWMRHPRLNPQWEPDDRATFDLGTVAHALLLEGIDKAEMVPASDWRTNAAKEHRDAARAAGRIPMLPHQYEAAMAMHSAAVQYLDAVYPGILHRSKREQTVMWREKCGTHCRMRLDLLTDDHSLIIDYKTTAAAGPSLFVRSMIDHGYDTQAVFYPRGLTKALGLSRRPRFIFMVQETEAPYLCYLVESAESMNELASRKVERAINLWQQCVQENRWPGYPVDVHQAEAPKWALMEEGVTE